MEFSQKSIGTVVNPSFVLGPAIDPMASSESFSVIEQFGDGTLKHGGLDVGMGIVDVRDLADIHIAAGFIENANGRNIASGYNSSFPEIAELLLPKYGDTYPLPRKKLPKFMLWLFGPMINKVLTRKYVSRNVGYPWNGDNSKSIRELGAKYRPLQDTVTDIFQQMIDNGRIKN